VVGIAPNFSTDQDHLLSLEKSFYPRAAPRSLLSNGYWVVKWQGCEADHSPPCTTEGKNGGAIPPLLQVPSWHTTLHVYLCSLLSLVWKSKNRFVRWLSGCPPPNIGRRQLGKHVPMATTRDATVRKLLDEVFLMLAVSYQISVCSERKVGN
jgi:hypothetical protein